MIQRNALFDIIHRMNLFISTLSLFLFAASLTAYDSMHEKTPVGEIKILVLPERIALEASTDTSYFSENNGLFRKLFRFINSNDISMTTPVEADIKPGKMRFFVGKDDLDKKINKQNCKKNS